MSIRENRKLITISLVFCGLVFMLFFEQATIFHTRTWKHGWSLGHVPLFLLVGYLVYRLNTGLQDKSLLVQLFAMILTGFFLGIGIEFIQSFTHRQASMSDVMLDVLGAVLAVPLFSFKVRSLGLQLKLLIFSLCVALLLMASWPFITVAWDEYQAYQMFPILSDFEYPRELDRWTGNAGLQIVEDVSWKGSHSLKVSLKKKYYSGVELQYFPGDWSGYSRLSIQAFNPQSAIVKLTVSAFDTKHISNRFAYSDRYTNRFILQPGWNEINILIDKLRQAPKRRQMDIENIRGLRLFVTRPIEGQILYIDDVGLK